MTALSKGESALGGNIKEGVVVTPQVRYSETSSEIKYLKFISDAYLKKATGEEFN